jgi:DNA mismatch repair ATPase MutL
VERASSQESIYSECENFRKVLAMSKKTRFQVDSRLASLLSQEYSSTEKALKELVDNGWDADAEKIFISLPAPMSSE